MDKLVNITFDLNEIVIETELEPSNIESVFETVFFNGELTKQRSFVYLDQDNLTYGSLSQFSKEVVEKVKLLGNHVTKHSHELLVKKYAEQRQLFVLILSGETFLVTESEMINLFLNKTKRHLLGGKLLKRKIDADVLIAMFVGNKDLDREEDKNLNYDNINDEIQKDQTNKNKNIVTKNVVENSNASSKLVHPRRTHTTTFVKFDRFDTFGENLILCANPNDKDTFTHDLYPQFQRSTPEDNYSTEVTEVDAGALSLEPHHRRLFVSSSDFESGRTGMSNSTTDSISFVQQAALRGSMATSSSGISFHSKPSRYPDYQDLKKRHESFHTSQWLTETKPEINLLVDCGFFFTGKEDLVRCYYCGIGLKDWIKDDDVITEHVKYSSSCDFLISKYGKHQINRMAATLETESNKNETGLSAPPPLQYKIRSPRYQTMEARVASFETFPSHIKIAHQQLAVAGLFHTGQGDLCRCFTCDGGLKDWKTGDDPIKEHATYFPNCPYINKLKGAEYVQFQQQSRTNSQPMGTGATAGNQLPTQSTESSPNLPIDRLSLQDTEYSSLNVSQVVQKLGYSEMDVITAKTELEQKGKSLPSVAEIVNTLLDMKERTEQMQAGATGQEPKTDLEAIMEENKQLSRLIYCMLCVNGEADILFLPCTHHRTCHECAAGLIYCPVCDQFIKEKVKTFRA